LNNLLSNAFKYTDIGKIILSVASEPCDNGQSVTLELSVRDTGLGMTEEQLGKLFGEYTRFNDNSVKNIEGTGLGLNITKRLVSLMGGSINVESEPGAGSVFIVRLPQKIVDGEVLGGEAAENLRLFRTDYKTNKNKIRIARDPMPYGSVLIVDDVDTNLYVAAGLLKLYKLRIDSAVSGREAIDKVKGGKEYDIIFMDHMMPEMDGMEAAKHLRGMGYKNPIVALTANAVTGQDDIFLNNGFDAFLSKPIDVRQLDSLLIRFIRDKQPPDAIEAAYPHDDDSDADDDAQANLMLLDSFARDAKKTLAVLEDLIGRDGIKNENGLKTFSLTVHGIRSSLLNIGEKALSESAKALELAGRSRDIKQIKKATPVFVDGLYALLDKIEIMRDPKLSGDKICPYKLILEKVTIDGLNVPKGLERYGGDAKTYLKILRSYAGSLRALLGFIRGFDGGDLEDYRIKIHGIKGAAYDIFSEKIAKAAEALEKAANGGNLNFIRKNNPPFIILAERFIGAADAVFSAIEKENPKPLKDKPDAEPLSKLLTACEIYDIREADAAMDEIERYRYKNDGGLTDRLREYIDVMNFSQAAKILTEHINTAN
jgi:CheY-like chemotaxis protein